MPIPSIPTIFTKFGTSVVGPGDTVVLPKKTAQPDYEAEFAFVIGKGGRNIPADSWQEHVFGYMNVNDVSARDIQLATSQWVMGKTFDTFCPMGPWIVTADEIADPHNLDISITVSGEVLQHSNTKHLIFRIPTLIEYLSSVFTLEPGDVISTGTPAGVGFARKPRGSFATAMRWSSKWKAWANCATPSSASSRLPGSSAAWNRHFQP